MLCEQSQAAKTGELQPAGGTTHLFAGRQWQVVGVDFVGSFPKTKRGNKWILVLVYHFTRWQDGIVLPDATAPIVITALDKRVFSYWSVPEVMHTDQRAQFEFELMRDQCRLWGVTHRTSQETFNFMMLG